MLMSKRNKKPAITFNRVTVLLYLTHFLYIVLLFGKGFLGGGVGNNAIFFIFLMAYVQ